MCKQLLFKEVVSDTNVSRELPLTVISDCYWHAYGEHAPASARKSCKAPALFVNIMVKLNKFNKSEKLLFR